MILDEVTSYLDATAEAAVLTELNLRREGRTIAFITHRPSILRVADRIVVLKDGQIAHDLTLGEGSSRPQQETDALTLFESL